MSSEAQDTPLTKGSLWGVLAWVPLAMLLLSVAGLFVLFLQGGLLKITAWYLLQLVPPLLGALLLLGVGVYALVRRRFSRPIVITLAAALLALLPAILLFVPITYPASLATTIPAVSVRLPADGPLRVIWGGDSLAVNQHAAVPDQRWAYDLLIEPYLTDSERLEDYGCYGKPVLAPIAGTVSGTHDSEPDMTPGTPSDNLEAIAGNYVAIKIEETGTYLLIAHLQPGSLRVTTGQALEEGQVIGLCGNSGNTSEPHIHIHHQRQDPSVYPINFAEGLPLYFRDHDGPPMPEGGIRIEPDGKVIATGAIVQHTGK
jgi:hypothetical protein